MRMLKSSCQHGSSLRGAGSGREAMSNRLIQREGEATRYQCKRTGESRDFWSGELFTDLKRNGLFSQLTDLASSFRTDGISIFQSRSAFTTWPPILQNPNLRPEISLPEDVQSKRATLLKTTRTSIANSNPANLPAVNCLELERGNS